MKNKLMIMSCSFLIMSATYSETNSETKAVDLKKVAPVEKKVSTKNVGLATKKVSQLKITSNSSELDYINHSLIFTGDVVVNDPQIELEADLMKITFTEKEEIKSFRATSKFDDVVIIVHREG